MTKTLYATKPLVKRSRCRIVQDVSHATKLLRMGDLKHDDETLPERLELILEKRGWSARKLSQLAGLKAETHVSSLINQGHTPNIDTAKAIAQAASVSLEWLLTGRGNMELPPKQYVERLERYPTRALAIQVGRAQGLPESVLAEVASISLDSDDDPGIDYWTAQVTIAKSGKRSMGRPPNDDEKSQV